MREDKQYVVNYFQDIIVSDYINNIEIVHFSYDIQTFAPTDSHSTIFDKKRNCIWIIGGYCQKNNNKLTTVKRLYLDNYSIETIDVKGESSPDQLCGKRKYVRYPKLKWSDKSIDCILVSHLSNNKRLVTVPIGCNFMLCEDMKKM
eukprot:25748_1